MKPRGGCGQATRPSEDHANAGGDEAPVPVVVGCVCGKV